MKKLIRMYWPSAAALCLAIVFLLSLYRSADVDAVPSSYVQTSGVVPILDAGHGGEDGGAVSITGTKESDINLDIVLKADQIFGLFGKVPVLTRNSDTISYPESAGTTRQRKSADLKQRAELIGQIPGGVLISVHQNKFTSEKPFGAQVLYGKADGSQALAETMQTHLIRTLDPENYRAAAAADTSIYLMKHTQCPGILIECGFLSNPREASMLDTDSYRLKVAAAIVTGFLQEEKALDDIVRGGIHES